MEKTQYKNPKPLKIKDTFNGKSILELMTKYFPGIFVPAGLPYEAKVYPHTEMKTPFTG